MPESEPLRPLLAPLRALIAWLEAEVVPAVVIGGVAASLLGRPRATQDTDVLVLLPEERWPAFLTAGARHGFTARIPDALAFARGARILLLTHGPSQTNVDLLVAGLPFEEEAITRAVRIDVGDLMLPVLTPEDLIVMKAVAHRPRDAADIESVLDANPKIDLRRVRRWVRAFADVMETPEVLDDLEAMLARRRGGGKRKKKA